MRDMINMVNNGGAGREGVRKMRKIAICDDDERQLEMMSEIVSELAGEDTFVSTFSSPLEMIHDILNDGNVPDLIVLDFCMREMDGIQALRVLRSSGIKSKAIFVSGYVEEISNKLIPSNNVIATIDKSLGYREFTMKVAEALDECQEPRFVLEKETTHDVDPEADTRLLGAHT